MAKQKKQVQEPYVPRVRVIRDTRDATKDYWLPAVEARELYNEGKLHWDLTNHCYGED